MTRRAPLPLAVVQDEFGDVIYWMRQILGLACGVTWGILPLVGGIWLLLYAAPPPHPSPLAAALLELVTHLGCFSWGAAQRRVRAAGQGTREENLRVGGNLCASDCWCAADSLA